MGKESILIVGAGRMAQAILKGIISAGFKDILVANSGNQKRLEEVESNYKVKTTRQWQKHVVDYDVVILAMPPEAHEQVLGQLSKVVTNQLVLTVAAGIDTTFLARHLPPGTAVGWFMPNTAAAKSESMTLFSLGECVTDEQEYLIEKILFSIGQFKKLSDQHVHQLTPITGSGPAFIYRMANSLVKETVKSGISESVAKKLVAQMIKGSAEMLLSGQSTPQDLIDEVASPGGVTEAGLKIFDQYHFDDMIEEVIEACHERAKNE